MAQLAAALFKNNGTVMRVTGQNVGIGTSSPVAKLEVDGTTRITDLSGSGNRMVIADADGDLSTQVIPSAGISTSNGLTLSSSDVKLVVH